jgi:glutathione S-transferase
VIRLFRARWSTNCERVSLALGHKGLEAESVLIDYSDRGPVIEASGQGLVPVIEDGGEVIADSQRILRHLEQRHPEPRLYPAGRAEAARVALFCEWFDRVWKAAPNRIEGLLEADAPEQEAIATEAATVERHLDLFEGLLDGRPFLAGENPGAADFVAIPFLKYAAGRDPADDELFHRVLDEHQSVVGRPNLSAWIEQVRALPRAYPEDS